jgi:hypothetical protein
MLQVWCDGIELYDRIDTRRNDTRFSLPARSSVPRFEWAFVFLPGMRLFGPYCGAAHPVVEDVRMKMGEVELQRVVQVAAKAQA